VRSANAANVRRGAVITWAALAWSLVAGAQLAPHESVVGSEPILDWMSVILPDVPRGSPPGGWAKLSMIKLARGEFSVSFHAPPNTPAVEIPACANLLHVSVDAKNLDGVPRSGPRLLDLPTDGLSHFVKLAVETTGYETRFACSYPPRLGTRETTVEGLDEFAFPSVHAREGGGKAVVFIPKGHDLTRPSALLVGLHPWNGGIWTYAAYAELLREANAKDVVLLMPSGLGNSLYTEHAEDEVLTAIDELSRAVAIDRRRVSIWGASMGGAGATTIGFHHPDRFATVTSFFGDSKYDLTTYVKAILHTPAEAHLVNALDVAENVRNVPVWLIHGEGDTVSPIAQSEMLALRLGQLGYESRFTRVPGMGHEGMLVAKFIAEVVDRAAQARIPEAPRRVSFVQVGPYDGSAYGLRFVRKRTSPGAGGDAALDVERQDESVHVLRARGLESIAIPRGAFGVAPGKTLPIVIDDPKARGVDVHWDALP
jgi:pimeloyl-ACP methyl ester carboxylesterase